MGDQFLNPGSDDEPLEPLREPTEADVHTLQWHFEHMFDKAGLDEEGLRNVENLAEKAREVTFEPPSNAEDSAIAEIVPMLQFRTPHRAAPGH